MKLSEKEKEFFEMLKSCPQWKENIVFERKEVMEQLGVDDSEYESIIKKFEGLGAICEVAQGVGQQYGDHFKIAASGLLQQIEREIQDEPSNK